ncbi:MAG: hypothetical protein IT244_04205 [Bacteroidia bacterium]|nr:hypothetical protein [Bacteroidia bacterium]
MKRTLFFTFTFFTAYCSFGQTNDFSQIQHDTANLSPDTAIRNLLMATHLQAYIGKTVADLLQNDTIKMHTNYSWSTEPPWQLQSLNLIFAYGWNLKIYSARENEEDVQFSMTHEFDLEAFKKLKIQELIMVRNEF